MPEYRNLENCSGKWLLPAWILSVLIHASILAVLCARMQPWTRGSADSQHDSVGIVLNHSTSDAVVRESNPYPVVQAALFEELAPPELLAVADTTTNEDAQTEKKQSQNSTSRSDSVGSTKKSTRPSKSASSKSTAASARAR